MINRNHALPSRAIKIGKGEKEMFQKKRAIPILVLTLMLLTLVPLAPVSADIGNVVVDVNVGVYDDTIIVTGQGLTAGEEVEVGWDSLNAWDGEKGILNSTEATGAGDFEIWFDVPEAVNGQHYIWLKSETDTWGGSLEAESSFTVNALIEFSPSSGLPGDDIEISGYGFDEEEEVSHFTFDTVGPYSVPLNITMSPSSPETDEVGSWSAEFEVPAYAYDTYTCEAVQNPTATATFTIGAAIKLDIEEGPVGTVVEIRGRGFTPTIDIDTGMVTIDGVDCYVTEDDTVDGDGDFTIECVIPSVPDEDDYTVTVNDGSESAGADFEVTGLAEIEVDPEFGVQGSSVDIWGWNFTQISGEDIVLKLWDPDTMPWTEIQDIEEFESDNDGEFEGLFIIPARSSKLYKLQAIQEDYNIEAITDFRIGMMIVIPTPKSGPSGTKVTLTGTGFTEGEDWNASLGGVLVAEGVVDASSNLEIAGEIPQFFVPTLEPGTYTLEVLDIDTEITVDSEFTVTDTTYITTDPLVAPNGYNITIEGFFFSEEEGVDVEFLLYNVTADGEVDEEWDVVARMGVPASTDVETDEDGEFVAWWEIPHEDDETIWIGEYWLNVTDDNDLYAQYVLNIVPKTVEIDPRKDTFANGETVAFNIIVSFPNPDSYIEIYDPDGELYWQTDIFDADVWIKVGTVNVVPYFQQVAGGNPMTLMDAALGTWSWTWFDDEDEEIDSGTFAVTEAPEDVLAGQIAELGLNLDGLMEDFVGLGEDLTGLSTDVTTLTGNLASLAGSVSSLSSDVTSLAGDVANAIQAANTASGKVDDLAETVADIAEVASNAATAAQNAAQAASAAQTAAEQTGQQTSGLTTLVYGAIGAALVAALAAIVSLMQISRRIAG
jgi:uncharacterized protein YoxC